MKTTGDGMLVEFASVVDAVACAVRIQRSMVGRNAGIPVERQIVFRIWINVGDIIIDGDDIFGDGVNIAARLETLCEPGGVCISRAANDQIRDKLSMAFADLGEQAVKNISRAVGVSGLTAKDIEAIPDAATLMCSISPARRAASRSWRAATLLAAAPQRQGAVLCMSSRRGSSRTLSEVLQGQSASEASAAARFSCAFAAAFRLTTVLSFVGCSIGGISTPSGGALQYLVHYFVAFVASNDRSGGDFLESASRLPAR
ncbi:adenylate/guanylate cyclase domain-containing protein [Bradyrhizobium sp. LLZ17]|uniref:adenylate/guanylate cyclase domain-containing protein n=1 Tax=Bradyrhizobium sp. LLZ17 TaxID=3239388 RepID=UPI00350FB956